jgi:hypothetical protein
MAGMGSGLQDDVGNVRKRISKTNLEPLREFRRITGAVRVENNDD